MVADAARVFAADYGGPGAPIAVIMPAYNEAESVHDVVGAVPRRICGLALRGDRDRRWLDGRHRTPGAWRPAPWSAGFLSTWARGRRYASATGWPRSAAAELIATVDADGQFDPGELPALVAPLVSGEADFVNGSRRLGRAEKADAVRQDGGGRFRARWSRALTRVRITDPANGLRAFRVEVLEAVPLRQTQYQTAELLIGAISRGFRVGRCR